MNPVALPIVGDVSLPPGALYTAIGAVILTAVLVFLWRQLGKGALVVLALLIGLIAYTVWGR